MYAPSLVKPVITDYVVVACCYRIGTYLTRVRRHHKDWVTEGRYNVKWDLIQPEGGIDGEDIRLLCAPDKQDGSIDELEVVRRFLQMVYNQMAYRCKVANRVLLGILDLGSG